MDGTKDWRKEGTNMHNSTWIPPANGEDETYKHTYREHILQLIYQLYLGPLCIFKSEKKDAVECAIFKQQKEISIHNS